MTEHRPPEDYDALADALTALPGVIFADHVRDPVVPDRPIVEAVVGRDYDRLPPRVLRTIADHDFGVWDVSRRGDPSFYVVVAL